MKILKDGVANFSGHYKKNMKVVIYFDLMGIVMSKKIDSLQIGSRKKIFF